MSLSLLSIFGAGVLTFVSPCVLPLIPAYFAALSGEGPEATGAHRRKRGALLVRATAFVAGLSAVFVALGALASSLGSVLVRYRPGIGLASGLLMLLFGLVALGVLHVGAFDRDARPALHRVRRVAGVLGAFLFGAAFALGWSPCIGPVLASVLGYAAAHADSPWRGAAYLAVYAAGLGAPLLLLAALADRAVAMMQRLRALVPRLQRLTGLALVAVGLWTIGTSVELRASESEPVVAGTAPTEPTSSATAATCGGDGHLCSLPAAEPTDAPAASVPRDTASVLEFTAQTCAVCERMVPRFERVLASCGLAPHSAPAPALVSVDVASAAGRGLADRYAVRGTPTFVLLDRQGAEHGRLLGEQDAATVAQALHGAFGITCPEELLDGLPD